MAKGDGKYVRRFDKNGNAYFINRETGRRVSHEKWQRERNRITRTREREREQKKPPPPAPPRPSPQRPAPPPPVEAPPPPTPPPFPPGVDEHGMPIDEDGEIDYDAFAIEGEDDT
jgi:hypothetical protein